MEESGKPDPGALYTGDTDAYYQENEDISGYSSKADDAELISKDVSIAGDDEDSDEAYSSSEFGYGARSSASALSVASNAQALEELLESEASNDVDLQGLVSSYTAGDEPELSDEHHRQQMMCTACNSMRAQCYTLDSAEIALPMDIMARVQPTPNHGSAPSVTLTADPLAEELGVGTCIVIQHSAKITTDNVVRQTGMLADLLLRSTIGPVIDPGLREQPFRCPCNVSPANDEDEVLAVSNVTIFRGPGPDYAHIQPTTTTVVLGADLSAASTLAAALQADRIIVHTPLAPVPFTLPANKVLPVNHGLARLPPVAHASPTGVIDAITGTAMIDAQLTQPTRVFPTAMSCERGSFTHATVPGWPLLTADSVLLAAAVVLHAGVDPSSITMDTVISWGRDGRLDGVTVTVPPSRVHKVHVPESIFNVDANIMYTLADFMQKRPNVVVMTPYDPAAAHEEAVREAQAVRQAMKPVRLGATAVPLCSHPFNCGDTSPVHARRYRHICGHWACVSKKPEHWDKYVHVFQALPTCNKANKCRKLRDVEHRSTMMHFKVYWPYHTCDREKKGQNCKVKTCIYKHEGELAEPGPMIVRRQNIYLV